MPSKISLDELTDKYYKKFARLPSGNAIVRDNQPDDAFELVVLEIMYGKEKDLDLKAMHKSDIDILEDYIVRAPDDGIDFVVKHETLEGDVYDFVQVKNYALQPVKIKEAINYMESTINTYIADANKIGNNLRPILLKLGLSKEDKANCNFIVVHRGESNYFKGQKENEHIVTGQELEIILNEKNKDVPKVTEELFNSDSFSNFIEYNKDSKEPAIIFNLCGYDLAKLALKYSDKKIGRNILFGQNLRESIDPKKSKTYKKMEETIRSEPAKFWFYNNGITMLCEEYEKKLREDKNVDNIILRRFSIINGAQTTSALGEFLKQAELEKKTRDINSLKKVFVLTRVLKVSNKEFASKIAIFNNTQNAITTRDMVSQREEQLELKNDLLEGKEPNIYMEVRRGESPSAGVQFYKHQKTNNEELAQLAFAGFLQSPSIAKDKKSTIFEVDVKLDEGQTDPNKIHLINEYYHQIFNNNKDSEFGLGILYQKTKEEIDELLFVQQLYKESKKSLNRYLKERIIKAMEKNNNSLLSSAERSKAINNVCAIYCISYYYMLKGAFSSGQEKMKFDYEKFYNTRNDKTYYQELIKNFTDIFLQGTIEIINDLSQGANLNTWIRDKKSGDIFKDKVNAAILRDTSLEAKFLDFEEKYS